ncbi:hypothetical protein PFISCL1PPCAC_17774, partial [Pristionchus fissidentatus]
AEGDGETERKKKKKTPVPRASEVLNDVTDLLTKKMKKRSGEGGALDGEKGDEDEEMEEEEEDDDELAPIKFVPCATRLDTTERLGRILQARNVRYTLALVMAARCDAVEAVQDLFMNPSEVETEATVDRVVGKMADTVNEALADDYLFSVDYKPSF